ncbi:hypothetical protein [Corynebacterium stationis]|uniref:hypothetical protein n=2 Tax=Corynebacterium stationis TaxID=1705 RepID=UPI00262AADEE|nr:hypothetical protein [Corynebacterium stationis]
MTKPGICFRSMPVFQAGRDADGTARLQTDGLLPFCLAPARTGGAQQDLNACAIPAVINVPVIAAAWFEGDIGDGDGAINKRRSLGLADKILGKFFKLSPVSKTCSKLLLTIKAL